MSAPMFFLEPPSVLREALLAANKAELIVAWFRAVSGDMFVFALGDGTGLHLPFGWLPEKVAQQARSGLDPNITDYGQTVQLGDYEIATTAITGACPSCWIADGLPSRHPGKATEMLYLARQAAGIEMKG